MLLLMSRLVVGCICICFASGAGWWYLQAAHREWPQAASSQTRATDPSASTAASTQRALLDQYCVTCHNETARTAGLALDKLDVEDIGKGAEVWEKVLHK